MTQYTIGALMAGMALVAYQPAIAQETGTQPLSGGAQLTVIGLLFALIGMILTKMVPAEAKRRGEELDRMLDVHRSTATEICDDIKTMTFEIKAMRSDSQKLNKTIEGRPCMADIALIRKLLNEEGDK